MSDNSHLLLLLSAKAQLSRGEQTVDDQYIFVGAIVDEFGLAILADNEQRRHFSLGNAGRELNIDLAAIIVALQLHFSSEVSAASVGLVSSPPERPCENTVDRDAPLSELDGDATDFLD